MTGEEATSNTFSHTIRWRVKAPAPASTGPERGRLVGVDMGYRTGAAISPEAARRAATQYTIAENGCWISDRIPDKKGYPKAQWKDADGKPHTTTIHRAAYQHHHGSVHPEYDVDHLCHDPHMCTSPGYTCPHRRCVNPDHLLARPPKENTGVGRSRLHLARNLAECPHGHAYDEANTYYWRGRIKECRRCHTLRARDRRNRARTGCQTLTG